MISTNKISLPTLYIYYSLKRSVYYRFNSFVLSVPHFVTSCLDEPTNEYESETADIRVSRITLKKIMDSINLHSHLHVVAKCGKVEISMFSALNFYILVFYFHPTNTSNQLSGIGIACFKVKYCFCSYFSVHNSSKYFFGYRN